MQTSHHDIYNISYIDRNYNRGVFVAQLADRLVRKQEDMGLIPGISKSYKEHLFTFNGLKDKNKGKET